MYFYSSIDLMGYRSGPLSAASTIGCLMFARAFDVQFTVAG